MSNKSISQSKIIILQKQRTSRSPKFDFGDGDVICFFKILFFTWVIELFDMASTWISKFQQLLWRRPLRPMGRSAFLGRRTDHVRLRIKDCWLYYRKEDRWWRTEDGGWRQLGATRGNSGQLGATWGNLGQLLLICGNLWKLVATCGNLCQYDFLMLPLL